MTWEDAWKEQRTPWDAGKAAPELRRALAEGLVGSAQGKRALVTGCGRGWDAFALAEAGFETTGLDISQSAAAEFARTRSELGASARVAVADFFTWRPAMQFDVIWDYTFLCALHPSQRHRWMERIDTLLAPGGILGTLIFPAFDAPADYQGPPWPLLPSDLEALTEHRFEAIHLAPAKESHPGREDKEFLGLWRRS